MAVIPWVLKNIKPYLGPTYDMEWCHETVLVEPE